MRTETIQCDGCGKSNHVSLKGWYGLSLGSALLTSFLMPEYHACSSECLSKVVAIATGKRREDGK
jgi:hypothetical protein